MGGFSKPKAPDPAPLPPAPPPPPTPVDPEVVAARTSRNTRARLIAGRQGDIRTSPQGLPSIFDTQRKTLLGR